MDNFNNITWLGHAGFLFTDEKGNNIYFIDPFQLENETHKKADLIFITHAHSDHFSPGDINKIIKDETIIIAPPDILEKIDISKDKKIEVKPNKSYTVHGFEFSTIPAYNKDPQKLSFHPKENNWVGYIFNLNGEQIYHAGDTDFTEEMKNLKKLKLDVAMLPIGGTYTMDAQEAAEAANEISATYTVPIHYKGLNPTDYKKLEEEFTKLVTNSKVVLLKEYK